MKTELSIVISPLILQLVIFQFTPLLTRPGVFFGATVDPGFPRSNDGRRVLRSYRWQVALWGSLAILGGTLTMRHDPVLAIVAPLFGFMILSCLSYWLKFREVHSRFGIRRPEIREAALSSVPEQQTISFWLLLPPLLAIPAAALYLHSHWSQIPATFPVNWGADGQPNRWASRDAMGVYGPLLMATFSNFFLLGLAWMILRLSRKTVMRFVTVRSLELLLYPLTLTFIVIALLPLMRAPIFGAEGLILACAGLILVSTFGLVYWSYRNISASTVPEETPEPLNDAYWKAGSFYYNPDDPAIFVSARVGIGFSMNFANKWSWVAMGVLLLVIAAFIYFAAHIAS